MKHLFQYSHKEEVEKCRLKIWQQVVKKIDFVSVTTSLQYFIVTKSKRLFYSR